MRAPKGEAYVAGLVSAPAGADAAGGAPAPLARRRGEGRERQGGRERGARGDGRGAGRRLARRVVGPRAEARASTPLSVAAATPDAKGAVSSVEVEVPDYGGAVLATSPLVLYPDEPAAAGKPDPRDPFAAFQMGGQLLHPRYGNAFSSKDALLVVAAVYGGKTDPATGQAALKTRFTILKDGKPVARGAEDAYSHRGRGRVGRADPARRLRAGRVRRAPRRDRRRSRRRRCGARPRSRSSRRRLRGPHDDRRPARLAPRSSARTRSAASRTRASRATSRWSTTTPRPASRRRSRRRAPRHHRPRRADRLPRDAPPPRVPRRGRPALLARADLPGGRRLRGVRRAAPAAAAPSRATSTAG